MPLKINLIRKLKKLRANRGDAYDSSMLNACCENHCIIYEVTPLYLPESNGVAKKKNRTLKNMVNIMLISSKPPLNLWRETMLSACHVKNRIPYKKIGKKTPYQLWRSVV